MNWLLENMEGIAFVFFACAVFGGISALFYFEKKRSNAIKAMASKMGFNHIKRDESFIDSHKNLEMFNEGEAHRLENILEGTRNGVKVVMGEYDVRFGRQGHGIHRPKTICAIVDPALSLPHFSLRRQQKIADKIGAALGGQDINFNEDKKFSEAFVLQGNKADETRSFFDADVRKAFMKFASSETQVEAENDTLVIHRNLIIEPELWSPLLRDSFSLYEALKKKQSAPAQEQSQQ